MKTMTTTTHKWIGLDHVQLAAPAGTEDVARKFFGELLGMPEVPKPRGCMVSMWCPNDSYWRRRRIHSREKSASGVSRAKHWFTDGAPASKWGIVSD